MAGYPARPFRGQVMDSELACCAVLSACGAEAVWARRARAYLNTVLMTNAAMKIVAAIRSNPPMISLFKVPLR